MKCSKDHIEMPIPDNEWRCPKCGSDNYNVEPAEMSDCELFHPDDFSVCYDCGYSASLKTIIRAWYKKKSMIKCPHCNGTGFIMEVKS